MKSFLSNSRSIGRSLSGGLNAISVLVNLRRTDKASVDDIVKFALDNPAIRPIQDHFEFLEFARQIASLSPKTVLEIGTFRGGTLFVFARLAQEDATLVSVDLPYSPFGSFARKLQEPLFRGFTRHNQRLVLIRDDSHSEQTRLKVQRALSNEVDLLFIDGDHSYNSVRADFEMYVPFVRSGGVVAFHDIALTREDYGVRRFWNEIKSKYRSREFVNDSPDKALGIGILWK